MTQTSPDAQPGFELPVDVDPARAAITLGPLPLEPVPGAAAIADLPPPLYAAGEVAQAHPDNKAATTALLLALGGLVTLLSSQGIFFFVALPAGLAAIVIGSIDIKQQRRSEQLNGRWMSVVGISVGVLVTLASMAVSLLVLAVAFGLMSDLPGNF